MANYILYKDGAYNLWSTIVDAPLYDRALTLQELKKILLSEGGESAISDLPARLVRSHATGCSAIFGGTLEDCVSVNRAGPNETCTPYDEFVQKYLTVSEE